MPSPTALSLKLLRKAGYLAEVCERWLPIPGRSVRRDLFRIGDVLAVHGQEQRFLLVQCTSLANISSRLRKAKETPELRTWLRAGGLFEVHGWVKRGEEWAVRRVALEGKDLAEVEVVRPPRRRRQRAQPGLFD
jgi:hypothetical protein